VGADGGEVDVKDGWEEWSRRTNRLRWHVDALTRTGLRGLPPITNNEMGLSRI
jgi:hypothetical protein